MSDLQQVKITKLVNAKVTEEIKVTFEIRKCIFCRDIHSSSIAHLKKRFLIPCYYVKMESRGLKREKRLKEAG